MKPGNTQQLPTPKVTIAGAVLVTFVVQATTVCASLIGHWHTS